jgi:hypothetical protein
MNFDPALIKAKGHGVYTPIPLAALPPLFLAYAADPSDSGRIHAPIKQRWLAGDVAVVSAMAGIAALADEGAALAGRAHYGRPKETRRKVKCEAGSLSRAQRRRCLVVISYKHKDNILPLTPSLTLLIEIWSIIEINANIADSGRPNILLHYRAVPASE